MSNPRMVEVSSDSLVNHFYTAIDAYKESIKTITNIVDTGGEYEWPERLVNQFNKQIRDCENLIEACEESDCVEFKRNEV